MLARSYTATCSASSICYNGALLFPSNFEMKQGGAELRHTRRSFIVLFLLGALSGQATAAEAQCPESAHKFWKSFRQTVLKGDKQKVAGYVLFHLKYAALWIVVKNGR